MVTLLADTHLLWYLSTAILQFWRILPQWSNIPECTDDPWCYIDGEQTGCLPVQHWEFRWRQICGQSWISKNRTSCLNTSLSLDYVWHWENFKHNLCFQYHLHIAFHSFKRNCERNCYVSFIVPPIICLIFSDWGLLTLIWLSNVYFFMGVCVCVNNVNNIQYLNVVLFSKLL